MKKIGIALALLALGAGLGLRAVAGEDKAAQKDVVPQKDVIWPAESIPWKDGPVKGTHEAKLWGDMSQGGPYGTLIKFDAGLMHDLHSHTQDLKIVIVSGTFVHKTADGQENKLGPGSYLVQKGRKQHISGCAAGADCVFFMSSADKFDMIPAKEAAK